MRRIRISLLKTVFVATFLFTYSFIPISQFSAVADEEKTPTGFVIFSTDMIERTRKQSGGVQFINKKSSDSNIKLMTYSRDFACADGENKFYRVGTDGSGKLTIETVPYLSSEEQTSQREKFEAQVPSELIQMIDKYEKDRPERKKFDGVSRRTLRAYVKVSTGFFAGFNQGEWGGSMIWFPLEGEPMIASGEHTNSILLLGNRIISGHGHSHMILSEGEISDNIWRNYNLGSILNLNGSDIKFPAPISKVILHNETIVGLMNGTPVFVLPSGAVIYDKNWRTRKVHLAKHIVATNNGEIWIGGLNQIGVWRDPLDFNNSDLFIREDCVPQDWEYQSH